LSKILVTIAFIIMTMSFVPIANNLEQKSSETITNIIDIENKGLSKVKAVEMFTDSKKEIFYGTDIIGLIRYYSSHEDKEVEIVMNGSIAVEKNISKNQIYAVEIDNNIITVKQK